MNATAIGLSGMRAAEQRLQASAANVANIETSGPVPTEGDAQSSQRASVYSPQRVEQREAPGGGVSARIVSEPAFNRAYDPQSNFADTDGMVAEPKVDLAREVVNQIEAAQQFAANLKTVQTATTMSQQILSIRV